jgi:hypothetical protein
VDIEAAEVSLDAEYVSLTAFWTCDDSRLYLSVVNDGGEPKINKVVIVTQSLPTAV